MLGSRIHFIIIIMVVTMIHDGGKKSCILSHIHIVAYPSFDLMGEIFKTPLYQRNGVDKMSNLPRNTLESPSLDTTLLNQFPLLFSLAHICPNYNSKKNAFSRTTFLTLNLFACK